jgi:hypothetical protein
VCSSDLERKSERLTTASLQWHWLGPRNLGGRTGLVRSRSSAAATAGLDSRRHQKGREEPRRDQSLETPQHRLWNDPVLWSGGQSPYATIVGGAQDLGVLSRPLSVGAGDDSWSPVSDGDGGLCVADDPHLVLDRFYYCLDFLSPYRAVFSKAPFDDAEIPIDSLCDKTASSFKVYVLFGV